ncbi:MAG: glycosyltransferase family 2 protein [Polyangiaceae bacterium]|nr:glycosyltransferase family 2 protein [Polyangiaceae bacterium]
MLKGATVAVVVPAHNEALLISRVLHSLPSFVDHVFVVDDASTDGTAWIAENSKPPDARVRVIRHAVNRGVGAAIATGYRVAAAAGADVVAVMAGDGQMDPSDLPAVLGPILDGAADYVKGVRLGHAEVNRMPVFRRLGTFVFGWATGVAMGLPSLSDSQCGYTAISSHAISLLDLNSLWPRFGYPNDLLCQVRLRDLRVSEVPVRPVYGEERSELRLRHSAVIAFLIVRGALRVRFGRGACGAC